MNTISTFVDDLIESFQCLPGIGPKSARRMVLYLLEKDRDAGKSLSKTLLLTLENVGQCNNCRMFSENEICSICTDAKRDSKTICLVESVSDVFELDSAIPIVKNHWVSSGE